MNKINIGAKIKECEYKSATAHSRDRWASYHTKGINEKYIRI